MFKTVIGAMAALSLATVPAMASAATASATTSLSAAKGVRAGVQTSGKSQLGGFGGGGFYAIAIVAGIIAIGVIAATKDDGVNRPTSP